MECQNLPIVSFVVPTYNEERNIEKCLSSVLFQDYPRDKMEILIVDGMSSDKTVDIARKYPVRIIFNKKIISASARNLGTKNAKGEILAFLDADSELPQSSWLRLMIAPLLDDPNVAGSIPILLPKKNYPAISRFFALLQADPIIVFAYGTGKDVKSVFITKENYFPMGVFVLRKRLAIEAGNFKPSLQRSEDVDITYRLVRLGYKFAMVPEAGLYHGFADSFSSFLRKTYTRVSSFIEFSSSCEFKYIPKNEIKPKFLKNILYDIIGIGTLIRIIRGIRRDCDIAWLYYPIVLLSTLFIYVLVFVKSTQGQELLREFIS